MKPSNFKNVDPYLSVMGKAEPEIIALNIMKILARTGDKFRRLSMKEYVKERLKDGNYSSVELIYFDTVVRFTWSASAAKSFAKAWNDIKAPKK